MSILIASASFFAPGEHTRTARTAERHFYGPPCRAKPPVSVSYHAAPMRVVSALEVGRM